MYFIAIQLTTAVAIVAGTLYNTYQPAFQNAYITKDYSRLRELFSLSVTLFILIYWLGMIGLWIVGVPLLNMIKQDFAISNVVLWGAGLMQFVIYHRNYYTSCFSCTNRILYVKSFICSSVVGLGLSVLLMRYFNCGIEGLIGGTLISQLMYNGWYWVYKAHREMRLGWMASLVQGTTFAIQKFKK